MVDYTRGCRACHRALGDVIGSKHRLDHAAVEGRGQAWCRAHNSRAALSGSVVVGQTAQNCSDERSYVVESLALLDVLFSVDPTSREMLVKDIAR
jgi:hypothetical protein